MGPWHHLELTDSDFFSSAMMMTFGFSAAPNSAQEQQEWQAA
jgi:hypothetical protein